MKTSRLGLLTAVVAFALAMAGTARADAIPYPTPGVQNPILYTFTATSTGNITAYYFGSTASYINELTMLVNGSLTGIQGLNTSSSVHGQSLVLGSVNAGDTIVFKMVNISPGGVGPWYSDKSLNSDGVNHVYATSFSGDLAIPAGTYVSFEDLAGGGDFNYNDENFVFTNVSTRVSTPETGSLVLLGIGLSMLAFGHRKLVSFGKLSS
jgi:hypothetical protein